MCRIAGGFLVFGAVVLGIGSFLTWATSEGGVPPRVEAMTPFSEDGGWLILASAFVALAAGVALSSRSQWTSASRWIGIVALLAVVFAFLGTNAVTDPAGLGNVGSWEAGPARPVMLVGIILCGIGSFLPIFAPRVRT